MPSNKPASRAHASLVAGFSCWLLPPKTTTPPGVNSYLGLLFSFVILVLVGGGGALIWYLSTTTEFSRAPNPPATAASPAVPKAPAPGR